MTVVIPAEAGIHVIQPNLGPRFRGDDGLPAAALSPEAVPAFCSLLSFVCFPVVCSSVRPEGCSIAEAELMRRMLRRDHAEVRSTNS
jgi:hypothetical protein